MREHGQGLDEGCVLRQQVLQLVPLGLGVEVEGHRDGVVRPLPLERGEERRLLPHADLRRRAGVALVDHELKHPRVVAVGVLLVRDPRGDERLGDRGGHADAHTADAETVGGEVEAWADTCEERDGPRGLDRGDADGGGDACLLGEERIGGQDVAVPVLHVLDHLGEGRGGIPVSDARQRHADAVVACDDAVGRRPVGREERHRGGVEGRKLHSLHVRHRAEGAEDVCAPRRKDLGEVAELKRLERDLRTGVDEGRMVLLALAPDPLGVVLLAPSDTPEPLHVEDVEEAGLSVGADAVGERGQAVEVLVLGEHKRVVGHPAEHAALGVALVVLEIEEGVVARTP